MNIEDAKRLKVGDKVWCPPEFDKAGYGGTTGGVGYSGTVEYMPPDLERATYLNIHDVAYIWVSVRHPKGTTHIWPSNRLG